MPAMMTVRTISLDTRFFSTAPRIIRIPGLQIANVSSFVNDLYFVTEKMKSHWRHHEIKTEKFHISFSLISQPKQYYYVHSAQYVHTHSAKWIGHEQTQQTKQHQNRTKSNKQRKKRRMMRTNNRWKCWMSVCCAYACVRMYEHWTMSQNGLQNL